MAELGKTGIGELMESDGKFVVSASKDNPVPGTITHYGYKRIGRNNVCMCSFSPDIAPDKSWVFSLKELKKIKPHCNERSMLYNGYADYLQNVVGKTTDYSVNPLDFDKVYTYKDIIDNRLMSKEKLENMRMENPKLFCRDFECKY